MRQIFIKSLICFLVLSSSVLAEADGNDSKISNDVNSIIQLQQQIEALQSEIQQVDTDNNSPTLLTYDSAIDTENATSSLKKLDCTLNVYFDSKMYLIRC